MDKIVNKNSRDIKNKFGARPNVNLLIHQTSTFHMATDKLVNEREKDSDVSFACKKGCSHCCNLRVEVLPPEAFLIANFIRLIPDDSRVEVFKKLEIHAAYAAGKTFLEYNKPCPFLAEDASCSIYSVRPHKCRAYQSTNLSSCETTRDADQDQMLATYESKLAAETIEIYKSKKCIMHPSELGSSVLASLQDESLKNQWASGKQVFKLLPERIML